LALRGFAKCSTTYIFLEFFNFFERPTYGDLTRSDPFVIIAMKHFFANGSSSLTNELDILNQL
jgi:hypothetical protein